MYEYLVVNYISLFITIFLNLIYVALVMNLGDFLLNFIQILIKSRDNTIPKSNFV